LARAPSVSYSNCYSGGRLGSGILSWAIYLVGSTPYLFLSLTIISSLCFMISSNLSFSICL
jgi:MFS-type transporter involved in bile tolerance (Atg22 family)